MSPSTVVWQHMPRPLQLNEYLNAYPPEKSKSEALKRKHGETCKGMNEYGENKSIAARNASQVHLYHTT